MFIRGILLFPVLEFTLEGEHWAYDHFSGTEKHSNPYCPTELHHRTMQSMMQSFNVHVLFDVGFFFMLWLLLFWFLTLRNREHWHVKGGSEQGILWGSPNHNTAETTPSHITRQCALHLVEISLSVWIFSKRGENASKILEGLLFLSVLAKITH